MVNTDEWRDLNIKWVLATYRNYLQVIEPPVATNDASPNQPSSLLNISPEKGGAGEQTFDFTAARFLQYCWPMVTVSEH
jgi:hypothetical protein